MGIDIDYLSSASEFYTVGLLERINDHYDDPTEIDGDLAMEAKWGRRERGVLLCFGPGGFFNLESDKKVEGHRGEA